jgi:3-methyl-2-oxobutanoate hydroxymethyltransferase
LFKISENLKYKNGRKITMLTCYDFTMASIFEISKENIDIILVGDSLGNVVQGEYDTLGVEVEDIIYHTKAVRKGAPSIFTVSDLPFMSYQESVETAVKNAGLIMKRSKPNAVKLEGGKEFIPHIERIICSGIPVMGHLGLTPQSVNVFGGYNVRGRLKQEREKIIEDAVLLEKSGVFAVVLECVPEDLAGEITSKLNIPVIGIGAGSQCDGQVLVAQDMLGMNNNKFKFVRKYADVDNIINNAVKNYAQDVRNGSFPSSDESFL